MVGGASQWGSVGSRSWNISSTSWYSFGTIDLRPISWALVSFFQGYSYLLVALRVRTVSISQTLTIPTLPHLAERLNTAALTVLMVRRVGDGSGESCIAGDGSFTVRRRSFTAEGESCIAKDSLSLWEAGLSLWEAGLSLPKASLASRETDLSPWEPVGTALLSQKHLPYEHDR